MSIALSDALVRDAASSERGPATRASNAGFKVGETAQLTVLERIDQRRYRALLDRSPRTIESSLELTPGSKLAVHIAAAGERLVLRSADPSIANISLQEVANESKA